MTRGTKVRSILALVFGIIALNGAVTGIYEALLLGSVLVPYSSLYESGGSLIFYGVANFAHVISYVAFVVISFACAAEAIGFGIPSLILSFWAAPGSKMKLFSRIFSIAGMGGGATVLLLMVIFLL